MARALEILKAADDPVLDELTAYAAEICETPVAFLGFTDGAMLRFRSRSGSQAVELALCGSFCEQTLREPGGMFVVENAEDDPRFAGHESVTGPSHARSYAGVRLEAPDGRPFGTLCVLDRRPRALEARQLHGLRILARQIQTHIHLEVVRLERDDAARMGALRRRRTEIFSRVLSKLVRRVPQAEVLEFLVGAVEEIHPGLMCTLMFLNDAGQLELHVPGSAPKAYVEQLGAVEVGPDRGSCGTAAHLRQPVFASDIATDPRWAKWRAIAAASGLAACASYPILASDGRVLGTYAAYSRTPGEFSAIERETLSAVTSLSALALELASTEARLREEESLLRAIVDGVPSMMFVKDARTFRMLIWNKASEQLTGVLQSDYVDHTDFELFPHEQAAFFRATDLRVIAEGRLQEVDEPIATPTGERWIHTKKIPLFDEQGGARFLIGISEDITERREHLAALEESRARAEQQAKLLREQATELEKARDEALEAVRTKGVFLANMSHEIRTPMNGVLGLTELLLGTSLTDEQLEYAGGVQRSAQSLLAIIDDILDVSKLESGRMTFHDEPLDLVRLAEDVVEMLAHRAARKGIDLVADVEDGLPDRALADGVRVRQILVNLAANAVKFTEKGQVTIRMRRDGTDHFAMEVIDTGIGIAPEHLDSVFESFSQADDSITRRYGGTGLGLTICRQLSERMGGSIDVTSIPGSGSCFSVRLPLRPTTTSGLLARVSPRRVLLVEPNDTTRRHLARHLTRSGHTVHAGASLAEARAALGETACDVILTDSALSPEGSAALAELWARDPASPPRLVVMTRSSADRGVVADRLPDALLVRPIRLDQVLAAVQPGPEKVRDARAPRAPAQTFPGMRVLLAEDNATNRLVATRLLQRWGCVVATAENGQEALDRLEAESFDVVLMDVQMPVLDGLAAVRQLRETEAEKGGHVPVVAMTAHAMAEDRGRCLAAGMDDYVSKPVRPQALAAALARIAGASPPTSKAA